MKQLFFYFSMIFFGTAVADTHCLVFVHIGREFPKHLSKVLQQARLFNPDTSIFLLGNQEAFEKIDLEKPDVHPICIESLPLTDAHIEYIQSTKTAGFWRYALERFLVLDDFIQHHKLSHVFHIENDVMLYINLNEFLPIFQACYSGMMTTTFDCDQRSVPSFVYFDHPEVSHLLAEFIGNRSLLNTTDMETLSLFKDKYYQTRGDHLPILIPAYGQDYPLTNMFKETARSIDPFCRHLEVFKLIFDAAALGQFLGGIDPILGESKKGFLGEASIFLPMHFTFTWKQDSKNRWIPYIAYRQTSYPIANLHIHSKAVHLFSSDNSSMPEVPSQFFSSLPFDHIQPKVKL